MSSMINPRRCGGCYPLFEVFTVSPNVFIGGAGKVMMGFSGAMMALPQRWRYRGHLIAQSNNAHFNEEEVMWEYLFTKHSLKEVKPSKPVVSKPGLRELAEAEAALSDRDW